MKHGYLPGRAPVKPVVTVVIKSLPKFRVPFYESLRVELKGHGVTLRLIYGQPEAEEATKQNTGTISWGHCIPNRLFWVGRRRLWWQPSLALIRDSDLVIVEQASKLLLNYVLLAWQAFGGPKVAFWGHGRNFQERKASRLGELVKRLASRYPHWWFAYTEVSAAVVRELHYPSNRITIVQNAIDTSTLVDCKLRITERQLADLRHRWSLQGTNVGVYAGSLYAEKRLPFLLEAAAVIRGRLPDFELFIIGAGPDQSLVEEAARQNGWIHYVGPSFGADKVPYFCLARVMLLPGAVGLAVLDSFALEVPLVTVDLAGHGPEIAYLRDGENGLKLPAGTDPASYAASVISLLSQGSLHNHLQAGCRRAAKIYTLPVMVDRFAEGVLAALELQPMGAPKGRQASGE